MLPTAFPDCFYFRWVLIHLKAGVESESAPAAVAAVPSHGHWWAVKKAIDLPLDGIRIQFLN